MNEDLSDSVRELSSETWKCVTLNFTSTKTLQTVASSVFLNKVAFADIFRTRMPQFHFDGNADGSSLLIITIVAQRAFCNTNKSNLK